MTKLDSNPSAIDPLEKLFSPSKIENILFNLNNRETESLYAQICSHAMMMVDENNLFIDNLKTHLKMSYALRESDLHL